MPATQAIVNSVGSAARRARATAASPRSSSPRASSKNTWPALVSLTPVRDRSNSLQPICASNRLICWLSAGCEMNRRSAAYSRDLDGEPVAVRVCGNDLVLVRLGGRARAFADLCPHRGARLSLGWVETDSLRCSYHGWLYDCSGV